jgi:hypothetical protein
LKKNILSFTITIKKNKRSLTTLLDATADDTGATAAAVPYYTAAPVAFS